MPKHIVHFITSLERGGAQAVLLQLVRFFAKKKYKQTIIFLHDGPYYEIFDQEQISLKKINGVFSTFDPFAFYHLYIQLKKCKPDYLHTLLWAANFMGRLVARILKIPTVCALHNNAEQNGFLRMQLDSLLKPKQEKIIAVSQQVKKSFKALYCNSTIFVIENGIDCKEIYKTTQSFAPSGSSNKHIIIGAVGRFVPLKRFDLLIKAFAQLYRKNDSYRLLLVGAGPEEENLRTLAQGLGLKGAIYWEIDKSALQFYSRMNCFVLASKQEGVPMALLEAMAAGIPCLITQADTEQSVIQHLRNGYVADANNATKLAIAIGELLRDSCERNKMAKNAQQDALVRFDKNRMCAAYQQLFEAL